MSESNSAERGNRDEEQVPGAKVIAQALKTQVRLTLLEGKARTEADAGLDVV